MAATSPRISRTGTVVRTNKAELQLPQEHQNLSVKQILVAEDEVRIANIVRDYLQRAGYRVMTAGDVPAAEAGRTRMAA